MLDDLKIEKPKTKEAIKVFFNLKINPSREKKNYRVLLLLDKMDKNLNIALHNIDFLEVKAAGDTCAYEIMQHKKIVITKDALANLTDRLKKC